MITFCKACDSPLASGAQFCSKCGAPVADMPEPAADHPHAGEEPVALPIAGPAEAPASTTTETIVADPEPMAAPVADTSERASLNWLFIGGGLAALLIIGMLYYFLFIADDVGSSDQPVVAEKSGEPATEAQTLFAMTEANIRDKPSVKGSEVIGKFPRGSKLSGQLVNDADDPTKTWLKLADGAGFVSSINLIDFEPPELTKVLGDKAWTTDAAIDIWKQPTSDSELLERVGEGTKLTLAGLTANDFIEVRMKGGGFGYLADGEAIMARLGGKPIALAFNPDTCAFGQEMEIMFQRLGAKSRAEWDAIEAKDYPNDEARDAALAKIEGKSRYERIQRSWNGLSITGIGQHYESQSVYFSDPPAKVMEVFRKAGFRLDREGNFPSTELYAGISAASADAAAIGKTDLGCGV